MANSNAQVRGVAVLLVVIVVVLASTLFMLTFAGGPNLHATSSSIASPSSRLPTLALEPISIAPPVGSAAAPSTPSPTPLSVSTYIGWWGWDGNRSIYPTLDRIPTPIGNVNNHSVAWQTASNSSYTDPNGDSLPNGNEVSLGETGTNVSNYEYVPGDGNGWTLNIFDTGVGSSTPINWGGLFDGIYTYAGMINVGEELSGFPNGIGTEIWQPADTGLNLTTGNQGSSNEGQTAHEALDAAALAIDIASVALGPAGLPLWPASIALDILSLSGEFGQSGSRGTYSDSPSLNSGNGTVNQWGQVAVIINSDGTTTTQNDAKEFSETLLVKSILPDSSGALFHYGDGDLYLQSSVGLGDDNCYDSNGPYFSDGNTCGTAVSGSSTSLYYPLWPAVSLFGKVALYPGGPAVAGATVTLAQSSCSDSYGSTGSADYQLTTNSSGIWHFFANPGCSYSMVATGTNPIQGGTLTSPTIPISSSYVAPGTESGNYTVPTLNLDGGEAQFSESGLASGTHWSVTLGGTQLSSTGGSITFLEPNGSYSFTDSAAGYSANPSSGSISVSGGVTTQSIAFTALPSYSVTFKESGLPSKYSWTACVSTCKSAAAGSAITFGGLTGQNSWNVDNVIVSSSGCEVTYYSPSPGSGTVSGASTISVSFSEVTTVAGPVAGLINKCVSVPASMTSGSPSSLSHLMLLATRNPESA